MSDFEELYSSTFFPVAAAARKRVNDSQIKFAYYTTAATGQLILKNEELWMRNTSVMNDIMEVEHGLWCLTQAYNSGSGETLRAALDNCFPGISSEISNAFNYWIPTIKQKTYITSVSEHAPHEHQYGRLSMWRAYGGNAGVAFIFNPAPMLRPSDALNAYSTPVAYESHDQIGERMQRLAQDLQTHHQLIREQGRKFLKDTMFEVFRFAALSTKHPAFLEEKEWRVISTQFPNDNKRLRHEVEVIGGIPQVVLKLKLEDVPEEGLTGVTIPDFLDHILIGPCEYPQLIAASFVKQLELLNVHDAPSKVKITGIPLRANQR